jgi:hypothetical protein
MRSAATTLMVSGNWRMAADGYPNRTIRGKIIAKTTPLTIGTFAVILNLP